MTSILKKSNGHFKGRNEYIVTGDKGRIYCVCKNKEDAEWIASLIDGNNENHWKNLCCRFVGRTRRLEFFKKTKISGVILNEEKRLIQKVYDEMTKLCLKDAEFLTFWGTE